MTQEVPPNDIHVCVQQPNGLKEVFEKFPKWFQEGYSGKGHEVRRNTDEILVS
jgi:hypothetical protein